MEQMRRAIKTAISFGRRDPTLFLAIFAAWALLNGLSLIVSENAFARTPLYAVALDLGLSDNLVGGGMVIDGVLLIWGLGDRPPRISAVIAMTTGLLWAFWSVLLFLGGMRAGLYSSSAAWTLLAACGVMRTSSGYAIVMPPPAAE